MSHAKYIFLDFDGVVHPLSSCTSMPFRWVDARERADFFHGDLVGRILSLCRVTGAAIVVSSAWRDAFSVDNFNEIFDGFVVGQTPLLPMNLKAQREGVVQYTRYREVLQYLADNSAESARWISVDDQDKHYPDHENIIITDPATGITERDCIYAAAYLGCK